MAGVDLFLKMTDIKGESTDSKHSGEVELESWSTGASNAATFSSGGGGGAGKVVLQDLHIVTKYSAASPNLFLGCASGKHFKEAVIVCRKAGEEQQEFLKITLSNVMISSYQVGGQGGGNGSIPMDQFALAFEEIKYEYKDQKSDGKLGGAATTGWNVKKNTKV